MEKFLSPFEIIAQPGSHSFMLKLLSDLCAIHPVFHISQLKPVEENTIPNCTQPPPPPVEVNGEEQYKIAQILDSKLDHWFCCPLFYRIQWLGYEGTDKEFAWLPSTSLIATSSVSASAPLSSSSDSKHSPLSSLLLPSSSKVPSMEPDTITKRLSRAAMPKSSPYGFHAFLHLPPITFSFRSKSSTINSLQLFFQR